jgi:phage terminase large subunit GpA-like protein
MRRYENAWGQSFPADMMAIDANYNTPKVHAWARKRERVMAVRGDGKRFAPVLGVPKKQEVSFNGKAIKGGLHVWPVGDWQAKLEIMALLRLEGIKEGHDKDPWGYCHFNMACDENYFKQLTSESLATVERHGKPVQEWIQTGQNHFLDCRKYNLAAADRLGINRFRVSDWEALAALRNVPRETLQGDLLDLQTRLLTAAKPATAAETPPPPETAEPADDDEPAAAPPAQPAPKPTPAPTPPPAAPMTPRPRRKSRIIGRLKF